MNIIFKIDIVQNVRTALRPPVDADLLFFFRVELESHPFVICTTISNMFRAL